MCVRINRQSVPEVLDAFTGPLTVGTGYFAVAMMSGMPDAAIGAGVDAMIHRDQNIYLRGGPRITVSPVFGGGLSGATVGVSGSRKEA